VREVGTPRARENAENAGIDRGTYLRIIMAGVKIMSSIGMQGGKRRLVPRSVRSFRRRAKWENARSAGVSDDVAKSESASDRPVVKILQHDIISFL
jgi:hypothetical protein